MIPIQRMIKTKEKSPTMSKSYLTMVELHDLLRLSLIRRYSDNAVSRHRLVMSIFPQHIGGNARANAKVLFRCERSKDRSFVLIRSNTPPANLPGVNSIEESREGIQKDMHVSFRITVTPIKRHGNKETSLSDFEDIEVWLRNRVENALSDVELIEIKNETVKREKDSKHFLNLVQIDGVAKIEDVTALEGLLVNGVGRNKNYGAGLLTVRPIG